jgi:16S rRNA G966 N2-methylase RsmD
MIITTAGRTNEAMKEKAKKIAEQLGAEYISRNKRSVGMIQKQVPEDCIVVGKERLELFPIGESQPFFFHPSSAMFRVKRLLKGEGDPFLQAAGLKEGSSILDCTLGLASDSITASYAAGSKGKVTGLEGNKYLSFLVANGLRQWDSGLESMNQAMRRIKVESSMALPYLKKLPPDSYDVVYFDPMFEEKILESEGIKALRNFAVYEDLSEEVIFHAKRAARQRVVLKDHFRSSRFDRYGFKVIERKSSKFHFGVIEK